MLAGTDLEFSVLYEPKGRFDYSARTVNFDNRASRETLASDLEHIAETLVSNPNYFHIDGRPVLYVYIAHTWRGNLEEAFAEAENRAGMEFFWVGDYGPRARLPSQAFDAVSPYNMYRPKEHILNDFPTFVEEEYRAWNLLSEESTFDFAPITLPGFDNTEAQWATNGQPVLERSPDQYTKLSELARQYVTGNPELILITSFNEWHEYTSVEPADEFDQQYLDITKQTLRSRTSTDDRPSLTPLRFHWEDFVLESSVNSDYSEGEGRRLTIAVSELGLFNGEGRYVRVYDIGGEDEPLLLQGISGSGEHNGRTSRWFTGNRNMVSSLYLPTAIAEQTQGLTITCRALVDEFEFDVTLGGSTIETPSSADRGWNKVIMRLAGQETPTETDRPSVTSSTDESHSQSPTEMRSEDGTNQPSLEQTIQSSSETTEVTEPGLGLLTGATGILGGAAALRRRARRPNERG